MFRTCPCALPNLPLLRMLSPLAFLIHHPSSIPKLNITSPMLPSHTPPNVFDIPPLFSSIGEQEVNNMDMDTESTSTKALQDKMKKIKHDLYVFLSHFKCVYLTHGPLYKCSHSLRHLFPHWQKYVSTCTYAITSICCSCFLSHIWAPDGTTDSLIELDCSTVLICSSLLSCSEASFLKCQAWLKQVEEVPQGYISW